MCRSRRELSNAYLLAKIGVDTAENEPLEVWGGNSIQYSLHSLAVPVVLVDDEELVHAMEARGPPRRRPLHLTAERRRCQDEKTRAETGYTHIVYVYRMRILYKLSLR